MTLPGRRIRLVSWRVVFSRCLGAVGILVSPDHPKTSSALVHMRQQNMQAFGPSVGERFYRGVFLGLDNVNIWVQGLGLNYSSKRTIFQTNGMR
jgi:hypothetical protein